MIPRLAIRVCDDNDDVLEEVIVPLVSPTLIGRAANCTYRLAPPLLTEEQQGVSSLHCRISYDDARQGWRVATFGAVDIEGARRDGCLQASSKVLGGGVTLELLRDGPPLSIAVDARTGDHVVEPEVSEEVKPQDILTIADRPYVYYPRVCFDMAKTGWHLTLAPMAQPLPILRLSHGGQSVTVEHEGVRLLAVYAKARRETDTDDWVNSAQSGVRYRIAFSGKPTHSDDLRFLLHSLWKAMEEAGIANAPDLLERSGLKSCHSTRRFVPDPTAFTLLHDE